MDKETATELALVRRSRVLFSHHSVGANVLAGLGRIDAEVGQGALRIVHLGQSQLGEGPLLIDASGGANGAPKTKLDFFATIIRATPGLKPTLAFMKFCFVDFNPNTDVDALFAYYQRTFEALKREHPEIRFAHVTVPLTRRPMEPKWRLYRLAGREVWEDAANFKRHMFNQKLLKTFETDPVFDLARAESTRLDGTREGFESNGQRYFVLVPQYTEDGGHLNDLGQRIVAKAMIHFMAAALDSQPKPPR